jgi:hypothetical protein
MRTHPTVLITLPALVLLSTALPATAQTPIYFWGLHRDCEQQTAINHQAERQLHSAVQTFALLQSPAGQPLPPCQGEACAQILRRACPAAAGRVLGGQVVQGRDNARFRLWLYDLGNGQIAVHDDYIQSQAIQEGFIAQAKSLIQNPRFGAAPGPKPSYCAADRPVRNAAESKGPLYLSVYGDNKLRVALHAALEQQLQLLGRPPQPVSVDPRTFSVAVLQQIVAGQPTAQVLGAESKKDGTVELFLFDAKTSVMQESSVSCPGCERDSAIVKVKQGVSDLLEHCFGMQCAQSGLQPPAEACEPFPEQKCAGLDELLAPGTGLPARHTDPTTAKMMKGALWGIFAGSAAAAIGLGVASPFVTQNVMATDAGGQPYSVPVGSLKGTAVALGVVSLVSLTIAVPVTISIHRAQQATKPTPGATPALIQCPN